MVSNPSAALFIGWLLLCDSSTGGSTSVRSLSSDFSWQRFNVYDSLHAHTALVVFRTIQLTHQATLHFRPIPSRRCRHIIRSGFTRPTTHTLPPTRNSSLWSLHRSQNKRRRLVRWDLSPSRTWRQLQRFILRHAGEPLSPHSFSLRSEVIF